MLLSLDHSIQLLIVSLERSLLLFSKGSIALIDIRLTNEPFIVISRELEGGREKREKMKGREREREIIG